MAEYLDLHPQNPQPRLIQKVVECLNKGGVIAYPTTSGYALGCKLGNLQGVERIRQIRKLEEKQDFTLMCSSISQAAKYAKVDDKTFRLIKSLNEGQYTFLLKSLPELPRKIQTNRKTVGIRIAGIEVVVKILEELDEPILSTSLLEPTPEEVRNGITVHHGFSKGLNLKSFSYGWDAKEALDNQIEICLEIGQISADPSTVLDLTEGLKIIREGAGSIEGLEEDE